MSSTPSFTSPPISSLTSSPTSSPLPAAASASLASASLASAAAPTRPDGLVERKPFGCVPKRPCVDNGQPLPLCNVQATGRIGYIAEATSARRPTSTGSDGGAQIERY